MKELIAVILCISLLIGLIAFGKTDEPEGEVSLDANEGFKGNPVDGKSVGKFSTEDLDGNIVTNKIFQNNNLTVLNIWGTFCGPCIEEIPKPEKSFESYY